MASDAAFGFRSMGRSDDDLRLYKSCFDRNGSPRGLEALRWMHVENPPARTLVTLASPEGDPSTIAGIYAVFPVWLKARDRKVLGSQSIDTLTDSDFRGRGLFVSLAKHTFAAIAEQGVACVYGFPNGNSAHGFFTRLGWSSMSPVPYLAKPLSASYLLDVVTRGRGRWLPDFPLSLVREAPLPSGLALREISAFDADFDRLWERFAASVGFCVWRDAAYLNWRIGAKPGQRYRTLALYEQGALRGFVTFCVKDRTRGRNGYVMELMHDPGRPDFATLLLRSALARIRADRADVALAWSLPHSPNHAAFRKLGFWMVPERFHPIELHFGGRALGPTLADIGGRTDWYISYLDSDTT